MGKKPKSEAARISSLPHEHFLNRELQALEFNRRVLAQAEDRAVPLRERLKFFCIVSSNLDEFCEIRASGVKEQIKLGRWRPPAPMASRRWKCSGRSPRWRTRSSSASTSC